MDRKDWITLNEFNPADPVMKVVQLAYALILTNPLSADEQQIPKVEIELYVDQSPEPLCGPRVTVPHDASILRFLVKPGGFRARHKLEGLDQDWHQRTDEMCFMIRFLNRTGDLVLQDSFPVRGQSEGWNGSVANSRFTPRREWVTVPPGAEFLSIALSSAGPASLIGVFAVSGITINSASHGDIPPKNYLFDSQSYDAPTPLWIRSGTHPSMASTVRVNEKNQSPILVIVDDDITAHADWASSIYALPKVTPGETLEVRWNEAFSTGMGDHHSINYERLRPGSYRFVVESVDITGEPLNALATFSVTIPQPYWKTVWFWGILTTAVATSFTAVGRHLIRRKIQRHLQQAQLITDERLRIARDLHDDLGTRLSHISLLGSYAESNSEDEETRATFHQITGMSRELIRALSETVWMLNPKNDDLESLVDFLCRLVSDLCKLSEIRCRIDAMTITHHLPINHEFRHNYTLAVKESVNNALKHSFCTEIQMKIYMEGNLLKITITDNGIGISNPTSKPGVGLESLAQRMLSIRGKCSISEQKPNGLAISLEAPLT